MFMWEKCGKWSCLELVTIQIRDLCCVELKNVH